MTTASPRASSMPRWPPKISPINNRKSVNAVSSNAVLKVFPISDRIDDGGGSRLLEIQLPVGSGQLPVGQEKPKQARQDCVVQLTTVVFAYARVARSSPPAARRTDPDRLPCGRQS